jgi:DNA-binding MarR family transcriptional regulator
MHRGPGLEQVTPAEGYRPRREWETVIVRAMDKVSERSSADESSALPGDEVLEFMRLLWAVDHGLQSTSKRMESLLGMTGQQRLALRLVGRFPGITAGRLAQLLYLHPSTLTAILKSLERGGLIRREKDPLDMRKALFTLTEAGRAQDVPSVGTVDAAVQRALSRVSRTRLEEARLVLTELTEELGVSSASLEGLTGLYEASEDEALRRV